MSLKFVPPVVEDEKQFPRYASYVHGREMKTHAGIGFAKNSLNNRMWTYATDPEKPTRLDYMNREVPNRVSVTQHAFLLESIAGEYFVLYEVKPGLKASELPWVKKQYRDAKSSYGTWRDMSRWSEYYEGKRLAEDPDQYQYRYVNHTMTTDQYVAFRLAVAREQWERETVVYLPEPPFISGITG